MDANSLALAALASVPLCQEPKAWLTATTSTMRAWGSSRGGAMGYTKKTKKAMTLVSTSALRNGP
jgi:hypothetical protein